MNGNFIKEQDIDYYKCDVREHKRNSADKCNPNAALNNHNCSEIVLAILLFKMNNPASSNIPVFYKDFNLFWCKCVMSL